MENQSNSDQGAFLQCIYLRFSRLRLVRQCAIFDDPLPTYYCTHSSHTNTGITTNLLITSPKHFTSLSNFPQVQLNLESFALGIGQIDSLRRHSNHRCRSIALGVGDLVEDIAEVVLLKFMLTTFSEEFRQVDDLQLVVFIDNDTLVLIEETPIIDIFSYRTVGQQ